MVAATVGAPHAAREVTHLVYHDDPAPADMVASSSEPTVLPSLDDVRLALPSCSDFAHMFANLSAETLPADDKADRRTLLDTSNYVLE